MIELKTLLLEATSDLYHSTSISVVNNILSDNEIKLTYAGGTRAENELQKGRPFYFSMSRQKVGTFVRGTKSTDTLRGDFYVILHLDGMKLGNNYKIIPVDYWQQGHEWSEQEDRLIAYKNKISPANKYIKGIHIFMGSDDYSQRTLQHIYDVNMLAKKRNVPIYFYDNKYAFYQLRTSKAIDLPNIASEPQKFSQEDNEYYNKYIKDRERSYYGEELLNMWKDLPPKNKREYDRLLRSYMLDYPYEIYTHIANDIHNSKREHPEYLQDLAREIKKTKSEDLKTFILKVVNKMRIKHELTPVSEESFMKYSR